MPRRNKFNAERTIACLGCGTITGFDGHQLCHCSTEHFAPHPFDSKKEHQRYCELLLLERGGEISQLKAHPRLELVVNGISVGHYTPDFRYLEVSTINQAGVEIFEDVKGYRGSETAMASFRRRVFEACYKTTVSII